MSELSHDVSDSPWLAELLGLADLALVQRIGFVSSLIVPLIARGRTIGVMACVSANAQRRYEAPDPWLAEELAHRTALTVDSAQLFREAQMGPARAR